MDQDRADPFASTGTSPTSEPQPSSRRGGGWGPPPWRDWWPPNRSNWWITALAVAVVVVFVVLLVALATGDGGDDPAPTTTPPTTAAGSAPTTATIVPDATTPPQTTAAPGAVSPTDVFGGNQPIAVRVDNAPAARPQIGLGDAEIIFEIPVEGGLTRFTALYLTARPLIVGPVRSLRPVDADILAPFRPVLVSTGGQSFVRRNIAAAGIVDFTSNEALDLFQVLERPEPHNLFATIPLVAELATAGPPQVAPLPFASGEFSGTAARSVRIPFSSLNDVTWTWDARRWVRSVNGAPFEVYPEVDAGLESLATDTVLVLSVAQRSAGYTDSAGADVPTFDVIGFGSFQVFHQGRVITGEWRRSSQEDGYRLIGTDGASIAIPPGRLFVEIVPRSISPEIG